jgi:hypothetical protein
VCVARVRAPHALSRCERNNVGEYLPHSFSQGASQQVVLVGKLEEDLHQRAGRHFLHGSRVPSVLNRGEQVRKRDVRGSKSLVK